MKVVGFSGYSGSGKTTLVEQVVAKLRMAGQRVSVIKHAHHAFDVDREGKDSWRHRQAGAFEVLVASDRRFAKMREFEMPGMLDLRQLIAELAPCNWVLVEGFKHSDLPKIEVWRAETGHPVHYPTDPLVTAVATDRVDRLPLPLPAAVPALDLNNVDAIVGFLLAHADRYEYIQPRG